MKFTRVCSRVYSFHIKTAVLIINKKVFQRWEISEIVSMSTQSTEILIFAKMFISFCTSKVESSEHN